MTGAVLSHLHDLTWPSSGFEAGLPFALPFLSLLISFPPSAFFVLAILLDSTAIISCSTSRTSSILPVSFRAQ
jgi:hypothetical protein